VSEVWAWIERVGIPPSLPARTFNALRIRGWIDAGITGDAFDEAHRRAVAARQRAGDPSPINIGFLSRFVDEVLAGKPERRAHVGGFVERSDAAVDAYLRGRS